MFITEFPRWCRDVSGYWPMFFLACGDVFWLLAALHSTPVKTWTHTRILCLPSRGDNFRTFFSASHCPSSTYQQENKLVHSLSVIDRPLYWASLHLHYAWPCRLSGWFYLSIAPLFSALCRNGLFETGTMYCIDIIIIIISISICLWPTPHHFSFFKKSNMTPTWNVWMINLAHEKTRRLLLLFRATLNSQGVFLN